MKLPCCLTFATAAGIALGLSAIAYACNVPVFRFALERWRADPYRIVLFHRGELSAADREQIRPLEEQQDRLLANLDFRTVDVGELDAAATEEATIDRELFSHLGNLAAAARRPISSRTSAFSTRYGPGRWRARQLPS
jgi:hypothetical protein